MSDLSEKIFHLENRMKNKAPYNTVPLSENKLITVTKPLDALNFKDSDELNDIVDNQKQVVKTSLVNEFKASSNSNEQQSSKENEPTFGEKLKDANLKQSISKGNSHQNIINDNIQQNGSISGQNANKSLKKRKHDKMEKIEKPNDDAQGHTALKKAKFSYKQQNLVKYAADDKVDNLTKFPSENSFNSSDEQNNNGFSLLQKGFEQAQIIPIGNNKKITDFFGNGNRSSEKTIARKIVISANNGTVNKPSKPNSFLYNKPFLNEITEEHAILKSWEFEKKEFAAKIKEFEQKYEHEKKERESLNVKLEKDIKAVSENHSSYQNKVQNLLAKLVLDNENMKRKEHKSYLQQQKQRLGEYISQR